MKLCLDVGSCTATRRQARIMTQPRRREGVKLCLENPFGGPGGPFSDDLF